MNKLEKMIWIGNDEDDILQSNEFISTIELNKQLSEVLKSFYLKLIKNKTIYIFWSNFI